jgi:hypothetical protein
MIQSLLHINICSIFNGYGATGHSNVMFAVMHVGVYTLSLEPNPHIHRFSVNVCCGVLHSPFVFAGRLTRAVCSQFLQNELSDLRKHECSCILSTMERLPILAVQWKRILRSYIVWVRLCLPPAFTLVPSLAYSWRHVPLKHRLAFNGLRTLRNNRCGNFKLQETYLDRRFPGQWIGRSDPQCWPSRSPTPALKTLDFCLWEHMKDLVYQQKRRNGNTRCFASSRFGCCSRYKGRSQCTDASYTKLNVDRG